MEFRIFQNLRMDRRHAVHRKAIVDIDVRHMYPVVPVDDPDALILRIFFPHFCIQFFYDRHQFRHHLLQIGKWPFLQRFRQNRVVCVGAGPAYHLNSLIHGESLILHQNPDQFRDHHGGMGIIDLDHAVIIKLSQILLLFLHLLQNKLGAVADHKVLLVDPQQIPCLIRVIGIQKQSQVLFDLFLVKTDTIFHNALIHRLNIKQMQLIDATVISHYVNVIKP